MPTKEEITERLSALRNVTPSGGNILMSSLESSVNNYFNRGQSDEEFIGQIQETLKKVVMESYCRNITYEREDRLSPMPTDFPNGYDNIMNLFNTNAFDEMMSIGLNTFRMAYNLESSDSGSTTTMTNTYITKWIAGISMAQTNQIGSLKALEDWCLRAMANRELEFQFEYLGVSDQHWLKLGRAKHAEVIYIKRGWDDLISSFNLNVYRPTYMPALKKGINFETDFADLDNDDDIGDRLEEMSDVQ